MKKILITNNSKLVTSNYDIVYTDSPYVIENHSRALYLDTLLDNTLNNKVEDISKKGSIFFQNTKIEI